jgi:hypothetical protein
VRSRRPAVLRRLHAVDATRVHLLMKWVVSFSILRPFGRDAPRRYLEKSGVIDALTKVLVGLYEEPERPPNAVDYIKRYMGAPTGIDVDALRQENEDLKKEREELRSTIDELNTRLTQGAEEED